MDASVQEGMERYKAAMERIRSGESEAEEVDVPSGRVLLTRDPDTPRGVKIEVLESTASEGGPPRPDPAFLETMKGIQGAMERFRAGDLDELEVPLPTGGTVKMIRDDRAPGAFTVRSPDGGPTMLTLPFEPASTRPERYPEDLPFLPDLPSAVLFMGEVLQSVSWFIPGDPDAPLEEIRRQLRAGGWDEGEELRASTAFGTMRTVEFLMGERSRGVMVSRFGERSQIRLMEKRKRERGKEPSEPEDQPSEG